MVSWLVYMTEQRAWEPSWTRLVGWLYALEWTEFMRVGGILRMLSLRQGVGKGHLDCTQE